MKVLISIPYFLIVFLFFQNCNNPGNSSAPAPSELAGDQLAKNHCGSCHQYVDPGELPKSIWKEDVLPAMGQRLGFYEGGERPDSLFGKGSDREIIQNANVFPEQPLLASADWEKIIDFYVHHAPDTLKNEKPTINIKNELKLFKYKKAHYSQRPPLTTLVKILPDQKGVVFADTKPMKSKLIFLNKELEKETELNFKTAPVHYLEKSDTLLVTTIGKNPFPNDRLDGDLQMVYKSPLNQSYNKSKIILPDLKRPVFIEYGDINKDGLEDVVVCEFGNHTGQLSLYTKIGKAKYSRKVLKDAPGAIHAQITDLNIDGYKDIIVLMSQGREGIFLFENNGDQTFTERELLSFSPLYGSQYFELCDFNKDGHQDILYVCGDNADKTPILKKYHGVYIFLNDGDARFIKSWFFPQNGAYKALPRDFDLDGDIDIASISFFPDYADRPEESFVYLENTGNMKFVPHSFPEADKGRWMVMDAGDLDNDGDLDLALGSFVYFIAKGDTTGLSERWMKEGPSVVILENQMK